MNDLIVKNVQFREAELLAVQDKETGKIYAGINSILRELGFDEGQIRYRRDKWIDDKAISKGVRKFLHPSASGGNQETYCIDIKKLPIALAKIEITPRMESEMPELSEKLEKYQDECADVLAEAFLHKTNRNEPKVESLDSATKASEFIKSVYEDLGIDKRYIGVAVSQIFGKAGIEIPIPIEMKTRELYDQTAIARELGIMSASGNPHAKAVGAIIGMLDIPDGDKVSTPYVNNGHSGVVVQYTKNVLDMVEKWISDNSCPATIKSGSKIYKVSYA